MTQIGSCREHASYVQLKHSWGSNITTFDPFRNTQLGPVGSRLGPAPSSPTPINPTLRARHPILQEMRTKFLTIQCPCGDTGIGNGKTCRNGITKEMPMEQTEEQKQAFHEDMIERMASHVQQVHGYDTWPAAKNVVRDHSLREEWYDDVVVDQPARSRSPRPRPTPTLTSAAASSASSGSRPHAIIGGTPPSTWPNAHIPRLHWRELYDVSGTRVMIDLSYSRPDDLRLLRLTINAMLQDGGGRS